MLLVALCFVTVLGISLAGYIAVCSRTMQISNRTFQTGLSQQLAEMGLEEALRAFNRNDWSDWSNGVSADWTVSGTTATCNLTFPAGKFGQGVTGSVKIRIDNYNANHLGSTWRSSKTYRIGEQVGYNGIWYSCVRSHSNQTPGGLATLAYWVPEPFPWKWRPNSNYSTQDVVNYDHDNDGTGTWFRCTTDHTSPATWTGTNWTPIGAITLYGTSYWSHSNGDIFYYPNNTTWYRWDADSPATTYTSAPEISWDYDSTKSYKFNDLVCYGSTYTWYRYINATVASGNLPTNTTYWENALTGGVHGWSSSSINYNLGDVVYYSSTGQWYRCILAHTSSGSLTPTNVTYWSNTPLFSNSWNETRQYSVLDTVFYNGLWYISQTSTNNYGQNPATSTGYWLSTASASNRWVASTAYAVGAHRSYGGVWYRCISATTGQSPNDSAYWTNAWTQSSGATTGATVIYAEGTINLAGSGATKTQLRANIAPAPLFPNAAGATINLTIASGTGTVDSYNSTEQAYSSGIAGSSAVLAAGSTLAINGTTAIKGYLAWPSPPGGISTGTTLNGQSLSADKSRISRSPFIPQFDTLPSPSLASAFGSWNFPYGRLLATNPTGTVTIGTPGAVTPSRYYFSGTLEIGGSGYDVVTLNIIGPVILYINGNLCLRSGGTVEIATTGSAEIHLDGGLRVDAASNGFINRTLDPKKLTLISDIAGTTTQYYDDTTNPFYGLIYVPKTTATLGFDIATGVALHGAVSARNITFSSEATLHYDTSLRTATISGVDAPYLITDWRELTDPAEKITLP